MTLEVGDQVRLRRRGGAVPRVYTITEVVIDCSATRHHRLFRLESGEVKRTAFEPDLIFVPTASDPGPRASA